MLCKLIGFRPQSWDLGLKAGIWASRLEFGPQGQDLSLEAGVGGIDGEGGEGKISAYVKA